MAKITGNVKSLSNGIFKVKDENGNVRVLEVGDEIYENDTVFGDSANSSLSQIEIQLLSNDVVVLNNGQMQLNNSSLIEIVSGTEELFFTREGLNEDVESTENNIDAIVF